MRPLSRYLSLLTACITMMWGTTSCHDDLRIPSPGKVSGNELCFTTTIGTPSGPGDSDYTPALIDADIIPTSRQAGKDSLFLHVETTEWPDVTIQSPRSRSHSYTDPSSINDMMVSAYYYDNSWDEEQINGHLPNYINNSRASRQGSQLAFDQPHFWPEAGNLRFLAFAPAAYGSFEGDLNPAPGVTVTIPEDGKNMHDFLVAYTTDYHRTDPPTPVPLNFKHALTAIKINMGADRFYCRVKRVEFRNIARTATFLYSNMREVSASTPQASLRDCWYKHTNPARESFGFDLDVQINASHQATPVIDTGNTFYVIPQTLGEDTELALTIVQTDPLGNELGGEEIIRVNLYGREWIAGTMVTYTLSYDNWMHSLFVTQVHPFAPIAENEGDHCVGSKAFKIQSFELSLDDHQRKPSPWTATFSTDGGATFTSTEPAWLDFSMDSLHNIHFNPTAVNEGSVDWSPYWVHAFQNDQVDHTIDINKLIYDQGEDPAYTETNPYNLSHPTGYYNNDKSCIVNTANCYIVERPGWYIIPAVYGNAIKNGAVNTRAFAPGVGGNHVLSNFVNHRGDPITSPYIKEHPGCDRLDSWFLWQDSPFLISTGFSDNNGPDDMGIVANKRAFQYIDDAFGGVGGLLFHVGGNYQEWNWRTFNHRQGNACIGLSHADEYSDVVWSWHIWVTRILNPAVNPDAIITTTNYNNVSRKMAMCYLGWVAYEPLKVYKERSCIMRITSTSSEGHVRHVDIPLKQMHLTSFWHGHSTYYQWGRKDPFYGANGDGISRGVFNNYKDPYANATFINPDPSDYYSDWDTYEPGFGTGIRGLAKRICGAQYWHNVDEVWSPSAEAFEGYDDMFFNLWDATCTKDWRVEDAESIQPFERKSIKTVYDPCPVGFKVPEMTAFSGIVNDGVFATNRWNWNGVARTYKYTYPSDPWNNRDAYGTHPDIDGTTQTNGVFLMYANHQRSHFISLPLQGYRDWRRVLNPDGTYSSGPCLQHGTDVYLWTAGCHDPDRAYYSCVGIPRPGGGGAYHVSVFNYYLHLDGCPILPIVDD